MPTYRAEPAALLRIVELDALTAIYHRRSGQTHLVVEPVPTILGGLQGRDATLEMLADDLGVAPEEHAALEARLVELVATGLVTTT